MRQKIGELANTRQQLDDKVYQLNTRWQQTQTLTSQAKGSKTRGLITLIIGSILFAFGSLGAIVESFVSPVGVIVYVVVFMIPGIILLLYGVFRWYTSRQSTLKTQTANYEITTLNAEIAKLNSSYLPKLTSLSQQILSELSSLHEIRMHPGAQSQSPQIVKETVLKEVVMIPCPYCKGLIPQTSVHCPHCGGQRRA